MDIGKPVAWDDIAGLEHAKQTIKEIVVWPMLRPYHFWLISRDIFYRTPWTSKRHSSFWTSRHGEDANWKVYCFAIRCNIFSTSVPPRSPQNGLVREKKWCVPFLLLHVVVPPP